MQRTILLLKSILIASNKEVVKDISHLFGIVDEEPITFTFILTAKRLMKKKEEELKNAISNDIVSILSKHGLHAPYNEIESYVNESLIVDVEGHNRSFESKTSGSDYGLLFEVPQLHIGEKRIEPLYNGILIQAKRNALKENKKFTQYGKLSKKKFNFSNVRHFMSLGLYKYENEDNPHLSDILFTPLDSIKGDNQDFVNEIKQILSGESKQEHLSSKDFYSLFFDGKIGTNDNSEIEKYIRQGKELPTNTLELRIRFKDDGEQLLSLIKRLIRQKQEPLVKEKQIVKLKRG